MDGGVGGYMGQGVDEWLKRKEWVVMGIHSNSPWPGSLPNSQIQKSYTHCSLMHLILSWREGAQNEACGQLSLRDPCCILATTSWPPLLLLSSHPLSSTLWPACSSQGGLVHLCGSHIIHTRQVVHQALQCSPVVNLIVFIDSVVSILHKARKIPCSVCALGNDRSLTSSSSPLLLQILFQVALLRILNADTALNHSNQFMFQVHRLSFSFAFFLPAPARYCFNFSNPSPDQSLLLVLEIYKFFHSHAFGTVLFCLWWPYSEAKSKNTCCGNNSNYNTNYTSTTSTTTTATAATTRKSRKGATMLSVSSPFSSGICSSQCTDTHFIPLHPVFVICSLP